jgi:hypothetical protein
MFKTKNDGHLADLETAVAAATKALVDTKAGTRKTWDKVKDIRAALEDSPDSPALAAGLREAEWRHREARAADDRAHEALRAAEAALAVAKESGPRADLAKDLQSRRRRIAALRNELMPGLRELEAEVLATFHNEILWSLPGAGQQMQRAMFDNLSWLVEHLSAPGGLDAFLAHLDFYASGVLDGSRPATLGANFVAEKSRLAKAG